MGDGKSLEKNVRKIIVRIVVVTSNILVLVPKLEDANTLGINKKITKGFTTPPVR